jgi:hypothetical protein
MKIRYILFACAFIFFIVFFIKYIRNGRDIDFNDNKIVQPINLLSPESITTISIKDTFMDVGFQKLHVPVKSNFIIYNTGVRNLYIEDVVPDCHCTVADFPKRPIKPHDSASVILKYNASNPGPFQSSAVITTNTNTSPRLIFMRGFVKEDG